MNTNDVVNWGLRVVLFTNLTPVYQLASDWARRHEHKIVLVVTTPGPSARRSTLYREVIASAPAEQDFYVTMHPRRLARVLAPLRPDVIVSGSFPHRIPSEVIALPRYGAYNTHPAMLPRYRGPNGARPIYDGEPTLAATLHRIDPDFDTGPIIYQREIAFPEVVTPESVFGAWGPVIADVWETGLDRGIRGDPGFPQDESKASYAVPFSEDEHWLEWSWSRSVLQRRWTALNLFGPHAKGRIGDVAYRIERVDPGLGEVTATPGTVVDRDGDRLAVAVGDGIAWVTVQPLTP
jgi:methionyl-tRNA formyltransferase